MSTERAIGLNGGRSNRNRVRPNNAAEVLAGPHDQAALLAQLDVGDKEKA
jgi:hypothetical protein